MINFIFTFLFNEAKFYCFSICTLQILSKNCFFLDLFFDFFHFIFFNHFSWTHKFQFFHKILFNFFIFLHHQSYNIFYVFCDHTIRKVKNSLRIKIKVKSYSKVKVSLFLFVCLFMRKISSSFFLGKYMSFITVFIIKLLFSSFLLFSHFSFSILTFWNLFWDFNYWELKEKTFLVFVFVFLGIEISKKNQTYKDSKTLNGFE